MPVRFNARHKRFLPVIGLLIGVQSLCLYSAVARLPVALALLAFNTYPIWTAVWSALVYRKQPERAMLVAMPVILFGLALALDVFGAASGLGAAGQWSRIGAGVAFALAAAATFGLALVLTQHEAGDVDGRVRTATTMAMAALVALASVGAARGLPPAAGAGRLGRAGGAHLPVRHRLHHHVHRAAAAGRGGQLRDHERGAGVRAGARPG